MHHASSHTNHVFLCVSISVDRLGVEEAIQRLRRHPLALAVQRARNSRHRHQVRSLPRMRTTLARTRTRFGSVGGRMRRKRPRTRWHGKGTPWQRSWQ